jgi:hypothetical protein
MPENKEQTEVPTMDKVLEQFSIKETAKEPDSKDEKVSDKTEETKEEPKEEKEKTKEETPEEFNKRVNLEVTKQIQSRIDKQFTNYYKERDELRKERDEAISKAEAREYDKRLDHLFGDEDEAIDENGKTVKKDAWKAAKEIVLDYKKNSRTVSEAMKELDKLSAQFEEKAAKNLGLTAKDPVERIHNLNRVIAILDDATRTNTSTEFYFDLRDKGLASASDKDSIIKRLTETQSQREWDAECKAIRQELSAKQPRNTHKPESNKSSSSGPMAFTRSSLKNYDASGKSPQDLKKDAEALLNQITKK